MASNASKTSSHPSRRGSGAPLGSPCTVGSAHRAASVATAPTDAASPPPVSPKAMAMPGEQVEEFRKSISELDAVLAVGVAAWLRKRGRVRGPPAQCTQGMQAGPRSLRAQPHK
jgi:hypothetical protein